MISRSSDPGVKMTEEMWGGVTQLFVIQRGPTLGLIEVLFSSSTSLSYSAPQLAIQANVSH